MTLSLRLGLGLGLGLRFLLALILTQQGFKIPACFAEEDLAAAIASGKRKSAACTACHGEAGISPNDLWPNLAKQKSEYLLSHFSGIYILRQHSISRSFGCS